MSWNVWNRPSGSFMVDMGIWGYHQTLWSLPLPNVTWHSGTWPYTMTPSIDQTLHQFANLLPNWTLIPILTFYDKRDDFNFHITNFPFLSSNIPSSPAYGVFISQLIRYARASSSYECFILRAVRLSNKLLGQGYVKERLRSSLRKFYGRYGDLIKQYEVPLSRMLHDILDDDHLQWHPPLIRHYTNVRPYYWSWPYYRIWLIT